MSNTDGIALSTIAHKMEQFAIALAEQLDSNDEAIDGYNRPPSELTDSNGYEFTAPAYLSFYSSTGTGTAWQDSLIESHEQAQAGEWARQYPDRADLFTVAQLDDSPLQNEAHEWLDAALENEAIYCSFEIWRDCDDVRIRAGFSDEINRPCSAAAQYESSTPCGEFLAMDDAALQFLIDMIETAIYSSTESDA